MTAVHQEPSQETAEDDTPTEELAFRRLGSSRTDYTDVSGTWILRRLPALMRQALALGWRTDRPAVAGLLVCQMLAGLLEAFGLLATTSTITAVIGHGDITQRLQEAAPSLIVLAGAVGLRAGLGITVVWLAQRVAPLIAQEAQTELLDAGTQAELVAYDHPGYNERFDSADRGAWIAQDIIGETQDIIASAVSVLAAAAVITVVHPVLLPLLMIAAVPRSVAAVRQARVHYQDSRRSHNERRLLGMLRYRLLDKREADQVRSGTLGPFLLGRYREAAHTIHTRMRAASWHAAKIAFAGALVSGVGAGIVWAILLWLLATGRVSVAGAGTAVIAMTTMSKALGGLVSAGSRLFRSGLYLDDWSEFIAEAGGHRMDRGTAAAPDATHFRAENISFHYPGADTPSIDGVTFEVRRGETVALVGENGSGKTTLAKLLTGLYLPDTGTISWDGHDLTGIDPHSLWSRVAHVPQEYAKWPLIAEENVTLGQPHDEQGALGSALRASGADKVVSRLRSGLKTLLASQWFGGQELSGGQWQRIALARAFYRKACLLVLDEPTSALDPPGEHRIFAGLRDLARDRAVVLITHRLANVAIADRIVVLDEGRIVQSGTFAELVDTAGPFRELWKFEKDRGVPAPRTENPA